MKKLVIASALLFLAACSQTNDSLPPGASAGDEAPPNETQPSASAPVNPSSNVSRDGTSQMDPQTRDSVQGWDTPKRSSEPMIEPTPQAQDVPPPAAQDSAPVTP